MQRRTNGCRKCGRPEDYAVHCITSAPGFHDFVPEPEMVIGVNVDEARRLSRMRKQNTPAVKPRLVVREKLR